MKKAWMIIVSFLACAFLVAACGYGGGGLDGGADGRDGNGGGDLQGNECQQAATVQMQGFDQACVGKGEDCCFCKCWLGGPEWYDAELYHNDQICGCMALPNPPPCEDDALTQAQACLANLTVCRDGAEDAVTNIETGICTLTPL